MAVNSEETAGQVSEPSEDVQATQEEVRSAFWSAVERGSTRLDRHWLGLLATGSAGGLDMAIGAFGLLVVLQSTRSLVLASLTFSIGFIVVVFADSELFTENFLVPIAAVATRRGSVSSLLRLWGATLVTNLAAGWLLAGLLVMGFPQIRQPAQQLSSFYLSQGVGWRSFSAAVIAGMLVTLMTWMNSITTKQATRLFSALVVGYLLGLGQMPHCIASGIEMFIALIGGAPFGYRTAFPIIAWMVLGNLVGGVLVASGVRLAQVGGIELRRQQHESAARGEQRDDWEGRDSGHQEVAEVDVDHLDAPRRHRIFQAIKRNASPSQQSLDDQGSN
ncbi:MAG: formate/nitrite transporter family protein [Actinomycetota bacterium]|nr:formate/nitrite transporter family protein [Actinomycetota bacterium]